MVWPLVVGLGALTSHQNVQHGILSAMERQVDNNFIPIDAGSGEDDQDQDSSGRYVDCISSNLRAINSHQNESLLSTENVTAYALSELVMHGINGPYFSAAHEHVARDHVKNYPGTLAAKCAEQCTMNHDFKTVARLVGSVSLEDNLHGSDQWCTMHVSVGDSIDREQIRKALHPAQCDTMHVFDASPAPKPGVNQTKSNDLYRKIVSLFCEEGVSTDLHLRDDPDQQLVALARSRVFFPTPGCSYSSLVQSVRRELGRV